MKFLIKNKFKIKILFQETSKLHSCIEQKLNIRVLLIEKTNLLKISLPKDESAVTNNLLTDVENQSRVDEIETLREITGLTNLYIDYQKLFNAKKTRKRN